VAIFCDKLFDSFMDEKAVMRYYFIYFSKSCDEAKPDRM
jgi:hypothetical protein